MHNPYNELVNIAGPEALIKLLDAHNKHMKMINDALIGYYREKRNKADLKRKIDTYV